MKSFYRTTIVQRQRLRMAAAAMALFVLGVVVGSLGGGGVDDSSSMAARHNKPHVARDLAKPLEQLPGKAALIQNVPPLQEQVDTPKKDTLREQIMFQRPGGAVHKDVAGDAEVERGVVLQQQQQPKDSPGRGLQCPPEDPTGFDDLQIPLKHLPRGKKTSVAQKYNRRAHNCISNGIWNRVTIDDHHKILHDLVRIGNIRKQSFVLDWGSGCGHSLQFLFDEYEVTGVGIDVSNLTIAYARSNTTQANLHCVADGTRLEWIPSNFFDHALSFGSIYHVYNRTLFCHILRQLVRVVRPGGTVYNGWTENAEYKRAHVGMCLEDLDATFDIVEERKAFADVSIFPLKAQQDVPNTYSLVITKTKPTTDDQPFLLENIPIQCGVHVCEKRTAQRVMQPAAAHGDADRDELHQAQGQEGQLPLQRHAVERLQEEGAALGGNNALPHDEEGDKEGWPMCPQYDANIERLQIPLEHLPRKKKTSVAQKYDRRAHNCASHGVWHRVTIADHEAILKRIGELLETKKDDVLFDWGSGCGHQLDFMTRMFGARGLGVDVSNLTIAYARANTTKVNRHCVADGSRLEWIPSNFFDHAYSFGSIYHVYNKSTFCSVLQQMVRVVKPGGKIYNGWTENKEYHRNDVVKCINTDTGGNHKISVLEEGDLFHHVPNFPLKQYRQTPNTYSLLIVKSD